MAKVVEDKHGAVLVSLLLWCWLSRKIALLFSAGHASGFPAVAFLMQVVTSVALLMQLVTCYTNSRASVLSSHCGWSPVYAKGTVWSGEHSADDAFESALGLAGACMDPVHTRLY